MRIWMEATVHHSGNSLSSRVIPDKVFYRDFSRLQLQLDSRVQPGTAWVAWRKVAPVVPGMTF